MNHKNPLKKKQIFVIINMSSFKNYYCEVFKNYKCQKNLKSTFNFLSDQASSLF